MDVKEEIIHILDTEYESLYPSELEIKLGKLAKQAKENSDEESLKIIKWEFDLLNCTIGHVAGYNGKRIEEISNKWGYYLETGDFKPLSNLPFCEWHEDAVTYYKQRYDETKSKLSKARYSFVIMLFSKGKDRLEWMEKSVDGWLKTAEKYINDGKYQEFFEVPPFAYEFALMLSISFGQKDLASKIFESLHKSILKLLEKGEKRWHLELFEVESKYIDEIKDVDKIKKDSVKKLREIIIELEKDDEQKDKHFLRHHIEILLRYRVDDAYLLNKEIAESYVREAELKEAPLIKSSFYNDAVKKYKLMQSSFPDKQEEIEKNIDEIILKLKKINSEINYKQITTEFTIEKKQIDEYIAYLKRKEGNIFETLLNDCYLFPNYQKTLASTNNQKLQYPLQFILPVVIYNKEEPIVQHITEDSIFDYSVRKNMLIDIKISEVMLDMTLETFEKELKIKLFDEADSILKIDDIKDIYPTLRQGYKYILGSSKDYIAGFHIIVPYFEEVIRRIIKKAGKVEVVLETHETKFFRGIELGGLLTDDQVKEIIGEDFQKSLRVLLVDTDQTNLRNELLHGRLESKKIIENEVIFVAYCLLKLIKILRDIKITS